MLTCSVAVWLLTTSPKSPEELQRDLPSAVDETGQVAEAVTQIVTAVDLVGVFFFAISGAILAVRKGYDIVGSLLLALMVGTGGGVIRDLIVNQDVPAAFRNPWYLILPVLASLAAREARRPVKVTLPRPLMFNNLTHRPATIQRIRIGADKEGLSLIHI